MNRNTDLDEFAAEQNITILETPCPASGSISLMADGGKCYIGIDDRKMTEKEAIVHKAHELGHCVTGSFYNRYSKFDVVSRHEARADRWAIEKLVPKNELIEALESEISEAWELAEHFNITEDFMIKCLEHYGYYHKAC